MFGLPTCGRREHKAPDQSHSCSAGICAMFGSSHGCPVSLQDGSLQGGHPMSSWIAGVHPADLQQGPAAVELS